MSDGRHAWCSTLTVNIGDGLGTNIQNQSVHKRHVVSGTWLCCNLERKLLKHRNQVLYVQDKKRTMMMMDDGDWNFDQTRQGWCWMKFLYGWIYSPVDVIWVQSGTWLELLFSDTNPIPAMVSIRNNQREKSEWLRWPVESMQCSIAANLWWFSIKHEGSRLEYI